MPFVQTMPIMRLGHSVPKVKLSSCQFPLYAYLALSMAFFGFKISPLIFSGGGATARLLTISDSWKWPKPKPTPFSSLTHLLKVASPFGLQLKQERYIYSFSMTFAT